MRSGLGWMLVVLAAAAVGGCSGAGTYDALAPDTIYHNGKVVTVNSAFDVAEAVAVRDGRIVAVGTNSAIKALAGRKTKMEHLQGKTVLPGFGDGHIHIYGPLQDWRDGTFTVAYEPYMAGVDNMEKLGTVLKNRAREVPAGGWVTGGLTREDWPNIKVPTRQDLDRMVPDHPVALTRGPHTAILNTQALSIVGITKSTPNPAGGWIVRDEKGDLTGRVLEAARRRLNPFLPPPEKVDDEVILERWRKQFAQLLSLGITHVSVAGVAPGQLPLLQRFYDESGETIPRMATAIFLRPGWDAADDPVEGARAAIKEMEGLGFHTGFGNERLKIGSIKLQEDGGLSAPVFWSIEPYKGRPDFYGQQLIAEQALYLVGKRAQELGWQLGVHTIGNAAIQLTTNVFERIMKEVPRPDARHFLIHASELPPEATLKKMADLKIAVDCSPAWITSLGGFAEEALDGERKERLSPCKTYLDRGIPVSFGSDQVPYSPIFTIWSAVTRTGWEDKVYGPEEKMGVKDAIRLHTLEVAKQDFDEKVWGSLEPGKVADMVILSDDILAVKPERIKDIRVERTILGGREVYRRGAVAGAR